MRVFPFLAGLEKLSAEWPESSDSELNKLGSNGLMLAAMVM